MKTVSKSKLKAKMLGLFREIERTGEDLVVTDRQKPVLRISAIKNQKTIRDVFAEFQGKAWAAPDAWKPCSKADWGSLA